MKREILHIPANLDRLTEITLQDVPDRQYTLRLFAENEEIEIQKTANRSWTPTKRRYALYFFTAPHTEFMHVQGCFLDIPDSRRDPYEDRLFLFVEESTE